MNTGKKRKVAPVAWMIIIGDGLHNFIDSLAIGAYSNSTIHRGVSTSLAMFCEELPPHDLGKDHYLKFFLYYLQFNLSMVVLVLRCQSFASYLSSARVLHKSINKVFTLSKPINLRVSVC